MNPNKSHGKSRGLSLNKRLARGVVLGTAAYSLILHPPLGGQLVPIQSAEAASTNTGGHAAHTDASASDQKAAPQIKMVTKYTCPMHPQIIEDHPGTCPICGMKLVKKQFPEQVGGHTQADAVAAKEKSAEQNEADQHQHAAASQTKAGNDIKMVTKYTCPMHPQIIEDHPGTCPICGMTLVKKQFPEQVGAHSQADAVANAEHGSTADHAQAAHSDENSGKTVTKYTCPMHPQIIEDHPGTCPICGMTLVKKQFPAGTPDNSGAQNTTPSRQAAKPASMPPVSVAPLTLKYMNVVLAKVQRETLSRQLHTVGFVNYDEDRLAHVHPRTEGWVEKLHVRSLGDSVEAGEPLLDVYSPDIVAAEKDYLVAIRNGMRDLRESARERLRLLNVPESVIDRIRKTGKVQRTVPILAPQSGYVAQINLREGMYIKPSLDLYTIADRKRVWVQVDVLERDMEQVRKGERATMTVDGLPGRIWHGKVDFVYPELDARSRTLKVRLAFNNPDGQLKPNQFAEVTINGKPQEDVLTVPTTALIPSALGNRVVRALGNGVFQPVPVRTGVSSDGRTQILSGLKPGDEVVSSGQFLIDSESNIQAAFQRMTGQAN